MILVIHIWISVSKYRNIVQLCTGVGREELADFVSSPEPATCYEIQLSVYFQFSYVKSSTAMNAVMFEGFWPRKNILQPTYSSPCRAPRISTCPWNVQITYEEKGAHFPIYEEKWCSHSVANSVDTINHIQLFRCWGYFTNRICKPLCGEAELT